MAFQPRAVARKGKSPANAVPPIHTEGGTAVPTITTTTTTPSSSLMIPRGIAKRHKPTPFPRTESTSSTQTSTTAATSATGPEAETKDPKQSALSTRLELILSTLEACLSDWGLSTYKSSGALEKFKDGDLHFQYALLHLPPIMALGATQPELRDALKSRDSSILKISDSGFSIRRIIPPNHEVLSKLEPQDWEEMTLYLENLPSIPGISQSPHSLSQHLCTLLSTSIQKIILPPLYHATFSSLRGDANLHRGGDSQKIAFEENQKRNSKSLDLPVGGGPFKGFAFAVVGTSEDARRILKEWAWNAEESGSGEGGEGKDVQGEEEQLDKSEQRKYAKLAKDNGLRVLSFKNYKLLQAQYLSYQKDLTTLQHATLQSTSAQSRPSRDYRDNTTRSNKHPRSDLDLPPHAIPPSSHKKSRRASSPGRWEKRIRTPTPPPMAPSSDDHGDSDRRGAYPKGCVIWLRNVYEKSTKGGLKSALGGLVEEIEEGSGTGLQYVDYDKGMDTCYMRFSSSHLSEIIISRLKSTPVYHLSPAFLSPSPSDSDPSHPALIPQLLSGERERLYWEALPEITRTSARKMAGGAGGEAVILSKKRRRESGMERSRVLKVDQLEEEEVSGEVKEEEEKLAAEVERVLKDEKQVVVEKVRKKPSKF